MRKRADLGEWTDVEALARLVTIAGLRLIDVGCGAGDNARRLAQAGARVIALDPNSIQALENGATQVAGSSLLFLQGDARKLPAESGAWDGVVFFRSLHHVPVEGMAAALAEAARALKPDEGFLCVVEPGTKGTHFPVMRPFHDETRVREAAQDELDRTATPLFRERRSFRYLQHPRYADFDAFADRFATQTFNDIGRERIDTSEVRALFEAGRTDRGDYAFEQPMLLDLFLGPRGRSLDASP